MPTPSEDLLMIFIKNPEKGKVKTRLAKDLGDEKALNIYHQLLEITRAETGMVNAKKWLWYSWQIDKDDAWSSKNYVKKKQQAGNLGVKMNAAFQQAFKEGFTKVLIIGSDCPEISKEILDQAFEALENHSVVIGPANDGGYYLLGMQSHYNLFENINWSTDEVMAQTIDRVKEKNLSFALLEELTDLDTINDLKKFDHLC